MQRNRFGDPLLSLLPPRHRFKMRRTEFAHGIDQVRRALISSQLQEVLEELRGDGADTASDAFRTRLLNALKDYSFEAKDYSRSARQITELMNLRQLEESDTWIKLISGGGDDLLAGIHDRVQVLNGFLPRLARLLEADVTDALAEAGLDYEEAGLLTVLLPEGADRFTTPGRITALMKSIDGLYEVCSTITGTEAKPLHVATCDSGHDKAFELIGTPSIVSALKQLIVTVWDRVVFFRSEELDARITRAVEALPMLEEIDRMAEADEIDEDQATLLRGDLKQHLSLFLQTGAMLPEMEDQNQHDPRTLLSPAPLDATEKKEDGPLALAPPADETRTDVTVDLDEPIEDTSAVDEPEEVEFVEDEEEFADLAAELESLEISEPAEEDGSAAEELQMDDEEVDDLLDDFADTDDEELMRLFEEAIDDEEE